MNKTEIEKVQKVFDDLGINLTLDDNHAEIEFWTDTAGQDIYFEADFDESLESFVRQVEKIAEDYDVDEECKCYMESLGKHGVPSSVRVLVDDCEEAENTLCELSDKLFELLRGGN